ncbi:MAG: cytidine deaminase [Ilumatobacteraceae bacterium]|nr:cytidine deaminase [Ilumatobacteraceae bacterium]
MTAPPDELVAAARRVHAEAYCPYSGYRVGAALRTDVGVVAAANVENAAYPLGTCAEAGAIAAMVALGGRRIEAVVVITDGDRPGVPCGGCRQRLSEFAGDAAVVHCLVADAPEVLTRTVGELLPDAFGPADLGERETDLEM